MNGAPSAASDGSMAYPVHLGIWTNWSRGPVLGATLTVDQQTGGLLIAILAFFITWVGTSFWRICCFIFHQVHSTPKPRDGLYHQRQAILRNASTAESGLTSLLETGWAWRRNSGLSICRTLPLALFAALCIVAFAFASAFSSKVSTVIGNEVLLSDPNCGYTASTFNNPDTIAAHTFEPYLKQNAISYANYAQQCYCTNTSSIFRCNQFIKQNLPSKIHAEASCPFGGDICRTESGNLALDTGMLDSHQDFGLNAPPGQRFQYRRRVQCAPLKTEDYSSSYIAPSGRKYTRYYYGQRIPQPHGVNDNYTYEYLDNALAELLETNMTSAQADYTLR
ncbi:hypothetical protein MPH_09999 [Macrophomina phaseolina MS6]|uniref:Uncharacterized protein n=1 Tax=Macrophomina phaseolina (strain MS6) TaxID=1126212 RepID=K2S7Q6_MACPH|nr:hypothetical protein MPH_09999 [Macrophomina phaseolina MS6]